MYSAARTSALPPHTLRWPRRVPESRFRGATPTRAATRLCVSVPRAQAPRPEQGGGQNRAYPGHASQEERLVLAQGGAALDRRLQIALGAGELLLKPPYVGLDALGHSLGRQGQAVVLCGEHPEQLPAAGHYGLQSADLSIGKGLWSGTYVLIGEARQDGRVDPISLGEGPRGPGEVAHLTGIDNHYRQSLRGQSPYHRPLEAAGGLK